MIVIFSSFAAAESFTVDTPTFEVSEVKEAIVSLSVEIKNLLNGNQEFSISVISNEEFIFIDDSKLILNAGEKGSFTVILDTRNLNLGVHTGKVVIESDEKKEIPVVFEVESDNKKFDLAIDIPQNYQNILPGGTLRFELSIYNFGYFVREEINVETRILDSEGNVLFFEESTIINGRNVRLTKEIDGVPDEIGEYFLAVSVSPPKDPNNVGTAATGFSISPALSPPAVKKEYLPVFLILIGVLVAGFFVFNHLWNKRLVDNASYWNKKVYDLKKIKFSDTAQTIGKLQHQRSLLTLAYQKRYIKKDSYDNGAGKIDRLLMQLKKRL